MMARRFIVRVLAIGLVVISNGCFFEPSRPGGGSGDDGDGGGGGTPNTVFVTSTTQPVGAFGSLDTADALCNHLASTAGLSGTYVAWLSSSTTSAKLRLGSARGWVRHDGLPFVDTVDDLVSGRIWYPPRIDETGADHADVMDEVATATHADGSSDVPSTCSDFTSTSLTIDSLSGAPTGGTVAWTAHETAHCGTPTRLYCFGVDRMAVVAPPSGTGRLAFLTSQNVDIGLGRDRADLECANEATSQGLPGMYLAFMATSSSSAASRFTTAGMPWYRRDGVKVTDDLVTLTAPIDVTAANQYTAMMQSLLPWTGAATPALVANTTTNCNDWMAVSGNGLTGDAGVSATSSWFFAGTASCSTARTAYCLQQ